MKLKNLYLLAACGLLIFSCKSREQAEVKAPEVPVASVIIKDVPLTQEYVGQALGESDIQIRARVQGFLTGIHFKEGSNVRKGQLLYSIDPLQYQTKVDQAKGHLAEAEATLVQAKSDLDRIIPLARINAVSQRDLVAAQGKYDAAVGGKAAAEAMVKNAQIELGYARITSPIDGIIGISQYEIGDYVGGLDSKYLNTVSDIRSVRVRFSVSESEYLDFRKRINPEDRGKMDWSVGMILSDGTVYPEKGIINLANREIDPSTGTLTMEATFPNPDGLIRPGQFAKVRFIVEVRKGAMLVPQRAVTELQGTYQVFVVGDDNQVKVKMVQAGQRYGEYWVIDSGLEPSDRVALIGNMAIRPNSVITPVPVNTESSNN
jgi:membrane fusion protein (multidrug efflux system)